MATKNTTEVLEDKFRNQMARFLDKDNPDPERVGAQAGGVKK